MKKEIKQRIDAIQKGQIPEGYKHSAYGVIPSDWTVNTMSDYLIESCVVGAKGDNAKKLTVKLWNKGVTEKKELHQGSENTQYYRRSKGQLIYSKLDFLNCAFGIIPDTLDGYESTQDLPAFDIDGVNPYYLLCQLTQRRFYERWGVMVANGGRKARRISPVDFLGFPMLVPPLPEQQKIAEILTTQDKVIELKEKRIAEKQRQKKYLMQQLLTCKKRVKGFSGEWESLSLGQIARKVTWKNVSFEFSIVLSNSAQNGIVPQSDQFDKDIANVDKIDGYYVVENGSFVYNPRISVTAPCGPINVNCTGKTGVMSPLYTVFQIEDDRVDNDFLKYYFKSTCWFRYMKGVSNYGVRHDRMSVSDNDFFGMPIPIPELMEQKRIAKIFSTADSEISLLKQDLEQEKQKKKALMQLLLTGIVRVSK